MTQESLFPGSEPTPKTTPPAPAGGRARFQAPVRDQGEWVSGSLDALVGPDHRARLVWKFVTGLDLSPFYRRIRSVEGGAGRAPIDPSILMALWLYATAEGVGSARALAKLCSEHAAYRWICGGVSINHHTLSDFRTEHGGRLDVLLTQSVAALMKEGLVDLVRVAQDGVKVRAGAGASSFRGKDALEDCLRQAKEQVETLRRELLEDPSATTVRQQAAKTRAAREREERVQRAIAQQAEAEKLKKDEDDKKKARASTTDADARVMKMGDGGFRPALNVQIATDTKSQIVVGVSVDNRGNDFGQLTPMLDQIEERLEKRPVEVLVDGGYVSEAEIETAAAKGTRTYAPVRVFKNAKSAEAASPHVPRPDDTPVVADWRIRMGTAEAKEIYKERAATAECVNALARNRGMQRFLVRGIEKAKAVALWFALVHNLLRADTLRRGVAAVA